jgi:hypothetical protein
MAACAMELGLKFFQLRPVVVWQGPHEAVHRNHKAPFVERGEADNVALGRIRHLLVVRRDPLGLGSRQASFNQRLQICIGDGGHGPRVTGRKDDDLFCHRNERRGEKKAKGSFVRRWKRCLKEKD